MTISSWATRNLIYPLTLAVTGQHELYARLDEVAAQQWKHPDELKRERTLALRRVLAQAIGTVPHYRSCFPHLSQREIATIPGADLWELHRSFPIVTKAEIQNSLESFASRDAHSRVGSKTTGGSTGEPVTIKKPTNALAQERAAMWLAYGWFGVVIGDRCLRFWGVPQNYRRRSLSKLADLAMNRRTLSAFSLKDEDLRQYWRHLVKFSPAYLHGYVSLIDDFARLGLEERLVPSSLQLKSVIVTAEVMSDPQRQRIAETFQAPVQVEYGCGEVGPIAHECPQGTLHVHSPNLEVEILGDDGIPAPTGRVVITDLHNLAMPLIRYDLGDFATWGDSCPCGRSFPTLEDVFGRAYDTVRDAEGRRFHGEFFMYLFEDLRRSGSSIQQFQITQISHDQLLIRIVCGENEPETEATRVRQTFSRHLPQFRVSIERVPAISRLPSGKMQIINNRFNLTT